MQSSNTKRKKRVTLYIKSVLVIVKLTSKQSKGYRVYNLLASSGVVLLQNRMGIF